LEEIEKSTLLWKTNIVLFDGEEIEFIEFHSEKYCVTSYLLLHMILHIGQVKITEKIYLTVVDALENKWRIQGEDFYFRLKEKEERKRKKGCSKSRGVKVEHQS
jgi:hypothetical protein